MTRRRKRPPRFTLAGHRIMLAVPFVLLALVVTTVDLKPHVDEHFFFSSSDPKLRETETIDRKFPSGDQLILSVSSSSISSRSYLARLQKLTDQLEAIDSVSGVRSLTDGPKDLEDAEKSPFWRRLLIAGDRKSSNVVAFVRREDSAAVVRRVEALVRGFDASDFRVRLAGEPYVVEMLGRNIAHDFRVFTVTAVALFAIAMWIVFRSGRLVLGMLSTCLSAVLASLLIQSMFGRKIGILTANLSTIVFVVTLSHLVYMTFNWQTLAERHGRNGRGLGADARRMTFPASFWSMICAALGFTSLLIVPANPLRELGFGGLSGTVIALISAYAMYPAFLTWAEPKPTAIMKRGPGREFASRRFVPLSVGVILASFALGTGLTRLNTDPSLLDYFKRHQELRDGLEYVDRNGGSNPLTIVVAADRRAKLNKDDPYHAMWRLQEALETHPGVGTVISLPVLLAEGKRHPFAFLFSNEHLLKKMEEPRYQRIARAFVTHDRTQAVFYLRMEEHGRGKPRVEVLDDLRAVVSRHGFRPVLVGGIYSLQGELAKMVASSLKTGLLWLMGLLAVVALVVARNGRGAAAMILAVALVPLCILGGVGLLRVPVDIISAPATNVCIGMAIDSMVHLMFGVRRARAGGRKGWDAWVEARLEQWRGIVYSDAIIAAGFAIFVLSGFPPTQRFGLVVVLGTIIDILANLFVLPLLGGAGIRRATRHGRAA